MDHGVSLAGLLSRGTFDAVLCRGQMCAARRFALRSPSGVMPDVQIIAGTLRSDPVAAFEGDGIAGNGEAERCPANFSGFLESQFRMRHQRQNVSAVPRKIEAD